MRITQSIFNDLQNRRTPDRTPASPLAGSFLGGSANSQSLGPASLPSLPAGAQGLKGLAQTTPADHDLAEHHWDSGVMLAARSHKAASTADALPGALEDSTFRAAPPGEE